MVDRPLAVLKIELALNSTFPILSWVFPRYAPFSALQLKCEDVSLQNTGPVITQTCFNHTDYQMNPPANSAPAPPNC